MTASSWCEDLLFTLVLKRPTLRGDFPVHRLREYLAGRYVPGLDEFCFHSVMAARAWLVRNWDYLKEVGLRTDVAIISAVFHALYKLVTVDHSPEALAVIPDIEPFQVVKLAQQFVNLSKGRL